MMTLRDHRRGQLLSIRDLAAKAGVSKQTVTTTERGIRPPRLSTMRKLCNALGVEPQDVAEFAAIIDADRPPPEETT